jgi:hypothetical protein
VSEDAGIKPRTVAMAFAIRGDPNKTNSQKQVSFISCNGVMGHVGRYSFYPYFFKIPDEMVTEVCKTIKYCPFCFLSAKKIYSI